MVKVVTVHSHKDSSILPCLYKQNMYLGNLPLKTLESVNNSN